ncbi:MAG TPA: hypothetical protein VMH61_06205, partial [Candidatus Acidoferrales bacterium]|nr:hypothetical protein [Candidatus Acidoferrales bacterium]
MSRSAASGAVADPDREPPALAALPPAAPAPAAHRPWVRRLARSLAWNAVSEFTARGASLWLSFACARALPVEAFGRFAYALALAQYVWLIGDTVANGGYATRELARVAHENPGAAPALEGRLLAMRLAAAAILTAVMLAVLALARLPADLHGALAGASVFFLAYAAFPDWALRAHEDFRGLALANAAAAGVLLAGTLFWLPRHPSAGVATALWAGSFAVAAAITLVRTARRRRLALRGGDPLASHTNRSFVFSLGAIGGIGCAQAPMLLVGSLATPLAAGLFGAAYRFLLVVINGFSVLWWPLMPVLVRSRPGERDFGDALAAMTSVVLLLGLPALLAFTLWPRELLTLAFGPRYAPGAPVLRIAGLVVPLFAGTALLEQTSLALGGEGVRARVNAAALAVLVGLGLLLAPSRGPAGVALALLAAYAVSFGAYAVRHHAVLPWSAIARRARGPLALNAGLAIAWCTARALHAPALPALVVAAALYL